MEKLTKKLRSKKGNALIQSLGLFLLLCVVFALVIEFARVIIVKKGVRELVTQAVTAGSAYNLYNAYDGVREENSATWDKAEKTAAWTNSVITDDVIDRMVTLFSMQKEGQTVSKFSGEKLEFRLEEMEVKADNPRVGSRDTTKNITYTITYALVLPWSWDAFPPMEFDMKQQSVYRPKY